MRMEREFKPIPETEFAGIGAGQIAYLREITGAEMEKAFPGAVSIDPTARMWALFGADGTPIVLADDQGAAIHGAFENNLMPVAVH